METKFTKGEWVIDAFNNSVYDIRSENKENIGYVYNTQNGKANAKLIAAAPEMFDEINETIIDLKILVNQIIDANKTNHLFDGMPELMQKWIDRKEQLLTKTTK